MKSSQAAIFTAPYQLPATRYPLQRTRCFFSSLALSHISNLRNLRNLIHSFLVAPPTRLYLHLLFPIICVICVICG